MQYSFRNYLFNFLECKDISTKCNQFQKRCGYNDLVRRRCRKTCGLCGKKCESQKFA